MPRFPNAESRPSQEPRTRTDRRTGAQKDRRTTVWRRILLLAVVGLAALGFAACSVSSDVEVAEELEPVAETTAAIAEADAQQTAEETAVLPPAENVQVLVVTAAIDEGTSVKEILELPLLWLSPRAMPREEVGSSAINNIAELKDLAGMVAARTIEPGELLDRQSFGDPGSATINENDDCTVSKAVDTNFDVSVENLQVLVLRQDIPAGFPVATFIEEPEFYLSVQRVGVDQLCSGAISQMTTLNAVVDQQALVAIPAGAALHEGQFG